MVSALLLVLAAASLQPVAGISTAGEARERTLEAAWSLELPTPPVSEETKVVAYKSPIKRVVALLSKMKAELEHEAAHEGEMYDRMVCWCKTNDKEKEQAIADAEARDKELSAEAEARAGKLGEQTATIAALQKQIAEDTEALKAATAMREKQAAEFSEEEKSLMQDLTNLKNAIAILARHHTPEGGASLVQLDDTLMSSLRVVLRDLALKRDMMEAQAVESGRLPAKPVASLLQAGGAAGAADVSVAPLLDALNIQGGHAIQGAIPVDLAATFLQRHVAQPTAAGFLQASAAQPIFKSYAPQSGQIFGILKQLQEEFEANLSQEQKDEMKAREDYEALSATKKEQIATGKAKLDAVQGAKADNQKALSDANENLQLTRDQRSEDVEFLRNLRLQCQDLDKQWELRSRTRAQEIAAVANATAILTDDDNMDLLRQTVAFIQVNEGAAVKALRLRAGSYLRSAASQPVFDTDDLLAAWHGRGSSDALAHSAGNPRAQLSTLAVSVGLDDFTKVKEMMDKMIADLQDQQKEEVAFKENCESEMNKNEKETYEKNEEKEDLGATIERLERLIAKLTTETAEAKKQIEETDVAIKEAGQNREKENAQFQSTVGDQRATQNILKKALQRLKAFYEKEQGGAAAPPATEQPAPVLLQAKQTPPEKFVAYKNNRGASPVIGLIEQIIEDSKALEKEAVDGEASAQAAYETFVKESTALISSLQQTITSNTKAKATAASDLEQAKSDHATAVDVLESLAAYEADLHRECDFVLKNFEKRQSARLAEIQAIQAAKAILSGAGLSQ